VRHTPDVAQLWRAHEIALEVSRRTPDTSLLWRFDHEDWAELMSLFPALAYESLAVRLTQWERLFLGTKVELRDGPDAWPELAIICDRRN